MMTILNLFSKYGDRKTQILLFEKNNTFNKGQDFAKKEKHWSYVGHETQFSESTNTICL